MYTAEDAKEFGDWTAFPRNPSNRIWRRPDILYSAEPNDHVRQTVLPYFIGVHSDDATLETETAGTIAELAEAYRTLTAPPRSPEGVKDGKEILFRFPAAVEVYTRYKLGLALTS